MRLIEIANRSGFAVYDNKVTQGNLFNYNSNKNKPLIRQDSENRSYKVYESEISYLERMGRVALVTVSSFLAMPLWSKDCRRLWNEATSGKEKVKVIFVDTGDEVAQVADANKLIPQNQAAKAAIAEQQMRDGKANPGSIQLICNYVDYLLNAHAGTVPTTFVIYMHLIVDSLTIDKQFLFKNDGYKPLSASEIKEKLQNYYQNEFFKEFNIGSANRVEYHILAISQIQNNFELIRHRVVNTPSTRTNQISISKGAVDLAPYWLHEHMPNAKNAFVKGEIQKLEGIYQPV